MLNKNFSNNTDFTGSNISGAEASERYVYRDLFLGSGLALCGNLLISISLNLQKYAHIKNSKREVQKHYTRDPLWWLGLCLMGLGEIGNFTAYGFAPASLVAPLGTITVIANCFLAAIFLKEKIRSENLFGCAVAIIGAFLIVTFSSQHELVMNSTELLEALEQIPFIVYGIVELGLIAVVLILIYELHYHHVVLFLLISSITASFTVISAKALSGLIQITFAGYSQLQQPILYVMFVVMIVTALIQVKYLNQAMRNFDSTVVVPTNFVFFTISAIVAGIIFYKEFEGMSSMDIGMFILGCLLSFVAVYFITVGSLFETDKQDVSSQQRVTVEPIPTWLLANVHVGQIQPQAGPQHLTTVSQQEEGLSDTTPILSSQHPAPITLADEIEDGVGDEGASVASPVKTYGATK